MKQQQRTISSQIHQKSQMLPFSSSEPSTTPPTEKRLEMNES